MLSEIFSDICSNYTDDQECIQKLWHEISNCYLEKGRYYHNLSHIEAMFKNLLYVKNDIQDWDTILFSMFYHDIIYNPTRKDNEERSAALVKERLQSISCNSKRIENCVSQILATKSHSKNFDNDSNLFIDADLAILGQDETMYLNYCNQIRMEYHEIPDVEYKIGRKRVLQHFLEMDSIYKTEFFKRKFEMQARRNVLEEIKKLV